MLLTHWEEDHYEVACQYNSSGPQTNWEDLLDLCPLWSLLLQQKMVLHICRFVSDINISVLQSLPPCRNFHVNQELPDFSKRQLSSYLPNQTEICLHRFETITTNNRISLTLVKNHRHKINIFSTYYLQNLVFCPEFSCQAIPGVLSGIN